MAMELGRTAFVGACILALGAAAVPSWSPQYATGAEDEPSAAVDGVEANARVRGGGSRMVESLDLAARPDARAVEARAQGAARALARVEALAPKPERVRAALATVRGSASYYANSLAGRRTASGERYDPRALTAAHRQYPFGTLLRVTNLGNDRTVEVRVTDRGPYARGRILDLSRAAAERLGFVRAGHTSVRIEVLEWGS